MHQQIGKMHANQSDLHDFDQTQLSLLHDGILPISDSTDVMVAKILTLELVRSSDALDIG